jgi:hypothetical protein
MLSSCTDELGKVLLNIGVVLSCLLCCLPCESGIKLQLVQLNLSGQKINKYLLVLIYCMLVAFSLCSFGDVVVIQHYKAYD